MIKIFLVVKKVILAIRIILRLRINIGNKGKVERSKKDGKFKRWDN